MINKSLIGDEKDQEIARLKMVIEKFKAYDRKRKEYYSSKMIKLGQLESYIQEIDSCEKDRIISLKKENQRLRLLVEANNVKIDGLSDEEIDIAKLKTIINNIKKQNTELRKVVKRQKDSIDKLSGDVYKLNLKLSKYDKEYIENK